MNYYGFKVANAGEQPAWFHTKAAARRFAAACGFGDVEIETTAAPDAGDVMDTPTAPWNREDSFGRRLLAQRDRLRLTQAGAAAMLDVGLSTYRAWETDDPNRVPLAITQEGALARLSNAKRARNAAP